MEKNLAIEINLEEAAGSVDRVQTTLNLLGAMLHDADPAVLAAIRGAVCDLGSAADAIYNAGLPGR